MDNRSQAILNAQMKVLFRGLDSYVMQRHITQEDISIIRKLDIELIHTYFPKFDEITRARALRTIEALEKEVWNNSS